MARASSLPIWEGPPLNLYPNGQRKPEPRGGTGVGGPPKNGRDRSNAPAFCVSLRGRNCGNIKAPHPVSPGCGTGDSALPRGSAGHCVTPRARGQGRENEAGTRAHEKFRWEAGVRHHLKPRHRQETRAGRKQCSPKLPQPLRPQEARVGGAKGGWGRCGGGNNPGHAPPHPDKWVPRPPP